MPTTIGVNLARQKLANDELVLCLGVNQMRTPNIAMIAAACGFDAIYIDLEHIAGDGGGDLRRGARAGGHADRARHLARSARRDAHPGLRRAAGDSAQAGIMLKSA
jgi:hypothetical protein